MQKSTKFWFEKKNELYDECVEGHRNMQNDRTQKLFYTIKYHSNGSCMHVLLTKHNATLKISKNKKNSFPANKSVA